MEIEIKPMSLDERLLYIQQITENQQNNTKHFPWGIAIGSCIAGAIICGVVIYVLRKKEEEKDKTYSSP